MSEKVNKDGERKVNCGICRYNSSGGQTMVCQYHGTEETSPYGDCVVFEEEGQGDE